jgi:hypothetical protein
MSSGAVREVLQASAPWPRAILSLAVVLPLAIVMASGTARAGGHADPSVRAWRDGGAVLASAKAMIAVPAAVAWEVMTDYEHMTEFVPDLRESRVLNGRSTNRLRVLQKGSAKYGWFSRDWEIEREIDLAPPHEIRSRIIRGSAKRMTMRTRLVPTPRGVEVLYDVESVPAFWVPPLIGPLLMRAQVRRQLDVLADEMLRRHSRRARPREAATRVP